MQHKLSQGRQVHCTIRGSSVNRTGLQVVCSAGVLRAHSAWELRTLQQDVRNKRAEDQWSLVFSNKQLLLDAPLDATSNLKILMNAVQTRRRVYKEEEHNELLVSVHSLRFPDHIEPVFVLSCNYQSMQIK